MSRNARLGVLAAVVAAAVLAFVLLRPGDDSSSSSSTTATAPARTTTAAAPRTTTTTRATAPAATTIRVVGKAPVGGVKDITVRKGERIRVTVTSDQAEHVHLHGYDIEKPVGPGQPARYAVPATITGVFEMELEDSGVQLAKVTVEP